MSDRTGTGATLSIGHKGAIHVTALAAGQRSSSFAPPPLRPRVSALSDVPLGSSDALLRNSACDRCWSEGDSKPQVFGFLLEPLDLLVLITLLIIFHPFVYVLLAVFEHAIDQPRQVVRHSRDRLRGSEFCAQPFELS